MSTFRLHPRPSFKRSHSDLSRSTTPNPPDPDNDDLRAELPAFLRQSHEEIVAKFAAINNTDKERIESFLLSLDAASDSPSAHPWAIELSTEAILRNRYSDIVPWSKSRIRLPVRGGDLDYINASPVTLKRVDGQHELRYIATQGPRARDVDHFWQMVWHQCRRTAVIVMLTPLSEKTREKCFQYFPAQSDVTRPRTPLSRTPSRTGTPKADTPPPAANNQTLSPLRAHAFSPGRLSVSSSRTSSADPSTSTQPHMQITLTDASGEPLSATVTLVDTHFDEEAQANVRKLSITCGDEARIVYHLLFSGWPDHAIPQGPNRAAMLALIRLSQERNEEEPEEQGPRIVHCSAGVGRTGTFMALEHLLAELDFGAWDDWDEAKAGHYDAHHTYNGHDFDHDDLAGAWPDPVFDTVSRLREQRPFMVQAQPQYAFIYEILAEEWVKRRRRLLEERRQLAGPTPKALRIGLGSLKKALAFGRDKDKDKDKETRKGKVEGSARNGGEPPRAASTNGAEPPSQG